MRIFAAAVLILANSPALANTGKYEVQLQCTLNDGHSVGYELDEQAMTIEQINEPYDTVTKVRVVQWTSGPFAGEMDVVFNNNSKTGLEDNWSVAVSADPDFSPLYTIDVNVNDVMGGETRFKQKVIMTYDLRTNRMVSIFTSQSAPNSFDRVYAIVTQGECSS